MRKRLRLLYIMLVLALLLLLGVCIFTFLSLRRLVNEGDMVAHTTETLFQVERVISIMKDAETGHRGFIITRDSAFLEPYLDATRQLTPQLKKVDSLISIDARPAQRQRFKRLSYLVLQRNVQLNKSLDAFLEPPGPDRDLRLSTRLKRGMLTMDSARMEVDSMQMLEKDLLKRRMYVKDRLSDKTIGWLAGVFLLAALVFGAAYYYLVRELRRRRQNEAQLEKMIAELQRSNHDLEQFAYVSSHHLQEPLRKLQIFSNLLMQKYQVEIGDETRFLMERINGSARQMQSLLDDLLTYTAIGLHSDANALQAVDLSEVLEKVVNEYEQPIKKAGARVTWDKRSWTARGDRAQLELLFGHLMQNSLKFMAENEVPQISIHTFAIQGRDMSFTAKGQAGQPFVKIVFSDNGIGIDTAYRDKIFGLFQRLQNAKEMTGTGIGLAICKRIIDYHNGFIELADSKQGATFNVYLPL